MLPENKVAFKEWASIVDVLGSGDQVLVLRKGGIHEKGKKFDVAYEEFFLFPTFEHQNPKDLKPEAEKILARVQANKPEPSVLPVNFYCRVEDSFWISDKQALPTLEPFHIWSRECIDARFEWGTEKGIFGILVNVFALPQTAVFSNLKQYGGCRSWVDLERAVSTSELRPVLPPAVFEEKKNKVRAALKTAKTDAASHA